MNSIDRKKGLFLFLSVLVAASASLVLLSLLSATPTGAIGPAQAGPVPCLDTSSTLEDLVDCIYPYLPRSHEADGRNGFDVPTAAEITQCRAVVDRMLRGECEEISLSKYDWGSDFTVATFTDTQPYCVFMETSYDTYSSTERFTHGWGMFIVNPEPIRELGIQIAHPIYDIGTARQGIRVFKGTSSQSFVMAGTHRHANIITSTCQSSYGEADVAHNVQNVFHPSVEALLDFYDEAGKDFAALQFHGMAASTCPGVDVYMTHGVSTPPVAGDKILELKSNLVSHNPPWTVTLPGDHPPCTLDGSENVQGRLLNGIAPGEVCTEPASSYSGRFVHVEQNPGPYRDADSWIDAINDTWAFNVSGTVTCGVTGPISDVEVYVWNRDTGTGFVGDVTDISGTFHMSLARGNYDLIFNPPCGSGCASRVYKGITGPPDVTLDVDLSPGHAVSGTVFATDGSTPVGNVTIYAFNHDTADGFGLPPTDSDGHYCIGLVAGHYDLGFTPPPCLGLGPKTEEILLTEDTVHDVILPPGFTVAGRVTDGAGDPVSGVQIYARECYTWKGYGFSPSNVDGYYTGTLPLGTFGIQFLPPAGQGLGPISVPDVVSATAGCPNTRLDVTLPAGFTISGRVTCQEEPVKNVRVHADPSGRPPNCYGLDEVGTYTVDDGSYELPLVSGTYTITFEPPAAPGFNTAVITAVQVTADTVLNVNLCTLFQKSVDELFAVPGERRTYRIVLAPEQDIAVARLTDTLPSAVTWAGDLSATRGSASYSNRTITWSGPLTTGAPVTITYGVTVTHAPRSGTAFHTDIYTDVTNDAVLDDGQGNVFTSTPAVFAIGHPFGTGADRTFDLDFGDADNDGDLDLAVGNHAPNQACWNNGDGSYDCRDEFGGSPTFDVDWGDLDGDGYLDLVVANSQGHSNLVCLNNRDRTFTCTSFSTCLGYASCDVALGDVDDDGDLDIALGNQKSQDLIYYNDGDGLTFPITDTTCYPGATLDLAFGDVDDDGDLDLAVVGHSPDFVCINDGTGTFTETRRLAFRLDLDTWCVALGDADGDGDLDIAAGEHTDYPIEIYLNNGHGYFAETLLIGPAWDSTIGLAWGDVDDDGDLDLASGNLYQQTVVYFNDPVTATDSITFSRKVFLGTDSSRTNSVAFGDVDADGDLDLAVGSDGGQNVIYLNTLVRCIYLPVVMKNR